MQSHIVIISPVCTRDLSKAAITSNNNHFFVDLYSRDTHSARSSGRWSPFGRSKVRWRGRNLRRSDSGTPRRTGPRRNLKDNLQGNVRLTSTILPSPISSPTPPVLQYQLFTQKRSSKQQFCAKEAFVQRALICCMDHLWLVNQSSAVSF